MTNNISFFNPQTKQMEYGSLYDLVRACNTQLNSYFGVDLSEEVIESKNVEFTMRARGSGKSTEYKEQLLRLNKFLQQYIARPSQDEREELKHDRIILPKLSKSEQEAIKRIMVVDFIDEGVNSTRVTDHIDALTLSVNRDMMNRFKAISSDR